MPKNQSIITVIQTSFRFYMVVTCGFNVSVMTCDLQSKS